MLGAHRHPDFWLTDHDLAGDDDDDEVVPVEPGAPKASGRHQVASSRSGLSPGEQARADSRDLFAARRAHARGEGPKPEAAPLNAGALGVAQAMQTGGR